MLQTARAQAFQFDLAVQSTDEFVSVRIFSLCSSSSSKEVENLGLVFVRFVLFVFVIVFLNLR